MEKPAFKPVGWAARLMILVMLSWGGAISAKERAHGAEVNVRKTDGSVLSGELIAVKKDSLLLMADNDISLGIQEIREITILRRSKFGSGLLYGLLLGAGAGALSGLADGDDPPGFMKMKASTKATILGFLGGISGTLIGGLIGALTGVDETITIEAAQDARVRAVILTKLRRYARFPEVGR